MIELHGIDGRSFRCAWLLEEVGVPYKRRPVRFASDTKTAEFLRLNPNGKIPVLSDGNLVLFESLAINVHLAKTYGGTLWPSDTADQSRVLQWMAWALAELEGPHDAANRSQQDIDSKRLDNSLAAMRVVLRNTPYLLGEQFSVADLNTAAVLMRPQFRKVAASDVAIGRWFKRCSQREALATALQS